MMPNSLTRSITVVAMAVVHAIVAGGVGWGQETSQSHPAHTAYGASRPRPPIMPLAPPPVIFEGFGLGDFQGTGSVAAALDACGSDSHPEEAMLEFKGIAVRGPNGDATAPAPMAAEVRSRIDRIDVAAGVAANPEFIGHGPSQWTGRIGVSNERGAVRESFELRTMLAPSEVASIVGVTVGPRFERRLRKGLTIFIDGQAEAQALRPADSGWLSLPGVADGSLATVGVTARTGIVR